MNSIANSYRTRTLCLAAWIAASSVACGGKGSLGAADAFSSGVFVGEVTGTDIRVGVVATARRARVFFCGGDSTYKTGTKWLVANIDSSHQLSLQPSDQETWSLSGKLVTDFEDKDTVKVEVGTAFTGTIDMGDGMPRPFNALAAADRTIAGLYEGMASCGRVGLIVQQPTATTRPVGQGACVGTTLEQVNPLDDIVRADDGSIRVTAGTPMEETIVRPAAPPED